MLLSSLNILAVNMYRLKKILMTVNVCVVHSILNSSERKLNMNFLGRLYIDIYSVESKFYEVVGFRKLVVLNSII